MICACYLLGVELLVLGFSSLSFLFILLLKSLHPHPKVGKAANASPATSARSSPRQLSPRKDLYAGSKASKELELTYHAPSGMQRLLNATRVMFLAPWLRLPYGSVLEVKIGGLLPELFGDRPSAEACLSQLCRVLHNAAYDPRIAAIIIKPAGIKTMWARLQELRRHIELLRLTGKPVWAYLERGGMREYYLASACKRIFVPPSAQLHLTGFTMAATYFRGVLDKVGVQPEVIRCGRYKSAADQFMAEGMSEANREQLTAVMADVQDVWLQAVAASRGKSVTEVSSMLDAAQHDMEALRKDGWLDGLMYETQMRDRLKRVLGSKSAQLPLVSATCYSRQPCFVPARRGGPQVAVIRAEGMIMGSGGMFGMKTLNVGALISQVRAVKQQRGIRAVVLRVDSPGGDALASDLMWREVHELALVKPVIASMGNVAGSGGYMLAMAANAIVAEELSIAGSIGVVSGKFNLEGLYDKTGYKKEVLTAGRFADLLADHRSFNDEEYTKFKQAADHTYVAFRDKAAMSRNMAPADMEQLAQGRIWSGRAAVKMGLADAVGGINRALMLAKEAAGISSQQPIRVQELSMSSWSFAMQMISSFTAAIGHHAVGTLLQSVLTCLPGHTAAAVQQAASAAAMQSTAGCCLAVMPHAALSPYLDQF